MFIFKNAMFYLKNPVVRTNQKALNYTPGWLSALIGGGSAGMRTQHQVREEGRLGGAFQGEWIYVRPPAFLFEEFFFGLKYV